MPAWKINPRWYSLAGAVLLAACGGAPRVARAPAEGAPTRSPAPVSTTTEAVVLTPLVAPPGGNRCPGIESDVALEPPALDLKAAGPSPANLRAWVDLLAQPRLGGRGSGTAEERRVALVLAESLAGMGWVGGMPDGTYCQRFGGSHLPDQNVVARLAPKGAAQRIIILGAHYDGQGHCGKGGEVCPSADDNASGVAALLEVARILAGRPSMAKSEVVISLFGAEERGAVGSSYFVAHPPFGLHRVSRMVNLDMVGRQLLDGQTMRFFLGSPSNTIGYVVGEREADASEAVLFGASDKTGTKVIGVPEAWMRSAGFTSDSVPFSAVVPTLFLSTSIHDDYHKPGDIAVKVDVGQIGRAVGLVLGIVEAG
jgi:hypothetical protein